MIDDLRSGARYFSVVCLLVAIANIVDRTWRFTPHRCVETLGTVVENVREDRRLQSDRYWSRIRVVVHDGRVYYCFSGHDTKPPYRVGDVLPVLYDPTQPSHMKTSHMASEYWPGMLNLAVVLGVAGFAPLKCKRHRE